MKIIIIPGWGFAAAAVAELGLLLGKIAHVDILPLYLPSNSDNAEKGGISCSQSLHDRILSLSPDFLVGWSLGAISALDLVSQDPLCCKGLVLLGATSCFCHRKDWPQGVPIGTVRAMLRRLSVDPSATLEDFARLTYSSLPVGAGLAEMMKYLVSPDEVGIGALQNGLRYLQETDLRPVLPQINIPTLVLHGEADRVVNIKAGEALAAGLPKATFQIFAEYDHGMVTMHPGDIAAAIRQFLATVAPRI